MFSSLPESIFASVSGSSRADGKTVVIVSEDERFLGVLGIADTVRPETIHVLKALKKLGIVRSVMLSGDNQNSRPSNRNTNRNRRSPCAANA